MNIGLDLSSKIEWISCVEILQKISQILHDHVGVIISLDKPVIFLIVILMHMCKCILGFGPKFISTLCHIEFH